MREANSLSDPLALRNSITKRCSGSGRRRMTGSEKSPSMRVLHSLQRKETICNAPLQAGHSLGRCFTFSI